MVFLSRKIKYLFYYLQKNIIQKLNIMYLCPLGGVSSQQLEDLAAMQRSTLANLPLVGGSGQAGSQPSSKGVRYASYWHALYSCCTTLYYSFYSLIISVLFSFICNFSLCHLFGAQLFNYLVLYRRMFDVNSLFRPFPNQFGYTYNIKQMYNYLF